MIVAGFIYGLVVNINDPEGLGQVIASVPGIFPSGTPYWCRPCGWPGAGGLGMGSQYPCTVGTQVVLMFEFGDPEAGAVFLPACYGRDDTGAAAGPAAITEVEGAAARSRRVVLWDDDIFSVHATLEGDEEGRKLVLVEKASGTNITIDARDGTDGNSKSIAIEAQTGVVITSKGLVKIDGAVVKINGRRILHTPGDI